MVSFQCDGCGDTVTKPKLPTHYSRCYTSVTCIDCSRTFHSPAEFKGHTSCISEAEKYQGKLYKGKHQNGNGKGSSKGGNPTLAVPAEISPKSVVEPVSIPAIVPSEPAIAIPTESALSSDTKKSKKDKKKRNSEVQDDQPTIENTQILPDVKSTTASHTTEEKKPNKSKKRDKVNGAATVTESNVEASSAGVAGSLTISGDSAVDPLDPSQPTKGKKKKEKRSKESHAELATDDMVVNTLVNEPATNPDAAVDVTTATTTEAGEKKKKRKKNKEPAEASSMVNGDTQPKKKRKHEGLDTNGVPVDEDKEEKKKRKKKSKLAEVPDSIHSV